MIDVPAMATLNPSSAPTEPCGRPTAQGKPCRQPRMPYPYYNPSRWVSLSCRRHATDAEWEARAEAIRAADRAEAEYRASLPVACWSWPVTAKHAAAAEDARSTTDAKTARIMAWDLMVKWQAGRCAVCGSRDGAEVLDHDHETGLARGWLCVSCNLEEGRAGDDPEPVVRYRTRNPATILGLQIVKRNPFGPDRLNQPLPCDDSSETQPAPRS